MPAAAEAAPVADPAAVAHSEVLAAALNPVADSARPAADRVADVVAAAADHVFAGTFIKY